MKTIDISQFKMLIREKDGEPTNDLAILETEIFTNEYELPQNLNTVIDVGAHIGGTAVLCASFGAKVYAFEPETSNFDILKQNVSLNGYEDKIVCIKKAVGIPGKVKILSNEMNMGNVGAYLKEGKEEEVEVVSLVSIFENNKIDKLDLLKLDCEGAEYDILFNLPEKYFQRIKQISVELHYAINCDKPEELVKFYGEDYAKRLPQLLHKFYKLKAYVAESGTAYVLICKQR